MVAMAMSNPRGLHGAGQVRVDGPLRIPWSTGHRTIIVFCAGSATSHLPCATPHWHWPVGATLASLDRRHGWYRLRREEPMALLMDRRKACHAVARRGRLVDKSKSGRGCLCQAAPVGCDGQTSMPKGVVYGVPQMALAFGIKLNISGPDALALKPARTQICLK